MRIADDWFSKYIRLRDSERTGDEWYGICITCPRRRRVARIEDGRLKFDYDWDAGHYVPRGNKVTRYDEENVNLQCSYHCNRLNSGNLAKYKIALTHKYGDGIPEKLTKLAEETTYYKLSKLELLEIIHDAKEAIAFYEKQKKSVTFQL